MAASLPSPLVLGKKKNTHFIGLSPKKKPLFSPTKKSKVLELEEHLEMGCLLLHKRKLKEPSEVESLAHSRSLSGSLLYLQASIGLGA